MPLLADLVAVLVFVVLGRRAHDEGSVVVGTLATAWPFLVGALASWAALLATRLDRRGVRAGLVVAAGTVAVGMALRHLVQGDGTPVSFVVVASVVNVLLLVGWRLVARRVVARQTTSRSTAST